jgi:AraC-like DNA-binding protein
MAWEETAAREPARPPAASTPRFRFSTDFIPETDRVGFFKEELAKTVLRQEVELLGESPPRYVIDSIAAGPAVVTDIQGSPTRVTGTGTHADNEDDGFLFVLHRERRQDIAHCGYEVALSPGDACLVQIGRPSVATYPVGGATLAIRINGGALRALVRRPEDLAGGLIDRARPGMSLLNSYLQAFSEDQSVTPELARTFGFHIVDLVASILGTTRDGAAEAEAGGVRAARVRQALDRIAQGACKPGFTIKTVAAELGVTVRTVQILLGETGSTFSEHVAEHRLRRAWRLLANHASRGTIAEVAYAAGYNDLANFHRAFRRRFGETPASVRGSGRPH